MCICNEVLQTPAAEKELKFVRPDKPRLVLGNGKRVLFEIVFVTEDSMGREVTLRCDTCGDKWVAKINGRYSVAALH